jgi:CRP-like cAMP-binding protein
VRCCGFCGERAQVGEKSAPHRGSCDDDAILPVLNPFSDSPPLPVQPEYASTDADDMAELNSNEKAQLHHRKGSSDKKHSASAVHISRFRRRGAVCGESPSHYLQDIKWWTRQNDGHSDAATATWVAEREVVRQVLLTHPFFTSCRHDDELMEEMLNAFERQETMPGEVVAAPGEMTAFHVVVKGRAVAESQPEKQGEGLATEDGAGGARPLQSLFSLQQETREVAGLRAHADDNAPHREWGIGEVFGNEGLLYPLSAQHRGACVRAASAARENHVDANGDRAAADTTVAAITWRLSRVRYQQLLWLHCDEQRNRILRALSHCPLFQHLTPGQLFELSERADIITRDAAVLVLSTSEVPTDLLVLMAGTVAVEHERPNGFGGQARIQAAVLGPGDCVGDAEWLDGCAQSTDTHDGGCGAVPSAYTYTTQRPVEAVRISLKWLVGLLSPGDVAAMTRGSRNVREAGNRRQQVREAVRALVEQSLLARLSESDDGTDSEATNDDEDENDHHGADVGGGQVKSQGSLHMTSSALRDGVPAAHRPVMDEVTVKSADVTNFLLTNFFTRPTYCRADGRERGLSMAAFTAQHTYPRGTVLFEVDYPSRDGAAPQRSSVLDTGTPLPDARPSKSTMTDRLYVVVSGTISMVDAESGATIFVVSRGGSVGEEGLLPPLRCSTAVPLHTRTIVTGEDGCVVYELSARAFREFLRRPYAAGIRHFCSVFCVLPYAEYFPENYWRFLSHCTTEREVVGGDLVAVRGAPCLIVALLLDGQVKAYREEGGQAASATTATTIGTRQATTERGSSRGGAAEVGVATFGRGDIVGGREAVEGRALEVAYVCECRTRLLCIPANSFSGLFRPALPYLQSLWSQDRYAAVLMA